MQNIMNKKNILFLFFFYSWIINAQINHWESVIYANDTWSYFVGNSQPASDWNQLSFDDSNWLSGPGGIGYGDGDDNTIINQTSSLYTRIKFNVSDASIIVEAILSVDYDDAFIAYLNGKEVARVGITGENPPYNQFADETHEAIVYQGGIPDEFNISSDMLDSCLVVGENVLALQIHNDDATSSDMSSTAYLSVGISNATNYYRSVPAWLTVPFEFTTSNIPIVIINTEGQAIIDEPKIMAKMGIINNENGVNNISDSLNEYDGWIGIENRGNASARVSDKKPYTIETRNKDGSNNNVKLLGLPKENDFVLRAGYIDKTLMRDALSYYIYRSMGRWAPRTRHVELVLNGNYQGVFILEEKIKPDKNRLDIAKMDSTDISGENLTGGYIWCTNKRWGDEEHNDLLFDSSETDGNFRFLKYPKPDDVMPEQINYISQFEQEFCDVMAGYNYNVPAIGYDKYINLDSFLDEIIIQEITSNSDAYGYSGFFHKDRGDKISAGPEWDFDQGLCNSSYNDGGRYDEWIITKPSSSVPPFWPKLFNDKDVYNLLKERWSELRETKLTNEYISSYIDSTVNYLNEAQQHNFIKWPILGVLIWRSLPGAEDRDTYQKEVDYMKDWLVNHLQWMDTKLLVPVSVDSDIGIKTTSEFKLSQNYPNPFNPETVINLYIPQNGLVKVRIYNSVGRLVKTLVNGEKSIGSYTIRWNGMDNFNKKVASGIYFCRVNFTNNKRSWHDTRKMILMK